MHYVTGLSEDIEIERYSDRFKQMTHAKREALASYLKQTPSNFPAELIQGVLSFYSSKGVKSEDLFS